MNIDILIEVYEDAPHGHGDVCCIDDFIDVSEEAFLKIKEYHNSGVDDLECMNIPELKSIINEIKEEHIDFARDRFFESGGEEDDFSEPDITITVADVFFEDE